MKAKFFLNVLLSASSCFWGFDSNAKAKSEAHYGTPIEYSRYTTPVELDYPDFVLKHLRQIQENKPHPVVTEEFEVIPKSGSKQILRAVSAAGRRPNGPIFTVGKSQFQLYVTDFKDRHLGEHQVVIEKLGTPAK